MQLIELFVEMCTEAGYVSQENAEWLRYALERRFTTAICFIPLLILGFVVANPATVIGFFIAFYFLRSRTNGFHAKSVGRCLLYSIVGEVLFMRAVPTVCNNIMTIIALIASCLLIWFLAPYNHPDMALSSEEVNACAKSAKGRLVILVLVLAVSYIWKQYQFSLGIFVGILMVATMLLAAYCLTKSVQIEERTNEQDQFI